jgi:hypothetical protein
MTKLPAWGVDDLPEPKPFTVGNMFRVIGPGAILLAASIGGGEWLVGPAIAVKHGQGLMWIATLGILLQVLFNLEAIRYTLYTGEPIYSGIMRLWPGPRFWGSFYAILTVVQLGVPALAAACATVLFTIFLGHLPDAGGADASVQLYFTYGVIALGVALLMFGGTVERMLEYASWGMVAYIFTFLIFVNVFCIDPGHSARTAKGFFQFLYIPENVDLLLLAALATTAGSGGIGNMTITNWVRDKGMGMGGKVGAIPSAFGGAHVQLSHVGKVFPVNEQNMSRWRTWWKYVVIDQMWLWALGCFLGMFLNVNLASAIIPPGTDLTGPAAGAFQAQYMAEHWWRGLWYLGLLNGFWILFSTHLGNTDVLVRTVTDIVWVASDRVRGSKSLHVGKLYYGLLLVFTAWGFVVVHFAGAMTLFQILAAVAGFVLVPAGIQILIVNRRMLPKELRPSWWRQLALVACSCFYAIVTALVIWDKLGRPRIPLLMR